VGKSVNRKLQAIKSVTTTRKVDIFVSQLHPLTTASELTDCVNASKTDGNRIHGTFVVGDGITTQLNGKNQSVSGALVALMSLYYIFDLAYPRPYAMFMGLLQHFVAEEPYKGETSRGFKTVVKQLDTIYQKTPSVTTVELTDD